MTYPSKTIKNLPYFSNARSYSFRSFSFCADLFFPNHQVTFIGRFCIKKVWKMLKHIAGKFHQALISYFSKV